MFLLFGDAERTVAVKNGPRTILDCPECGRKEQFHERVVSRQFRMYFVEMFTHGTHHVMAYNGCGAAFVTDEMRELHGNDNHDGAVLGHVQQALDHTKRAVTDGTVGDALARGSDEAGASLDESTIDGWFCPVRSLVEAPPKIRCRRIDVPARWYKPCRAPVSTFFREMGDQLFPAVTSSPRMSPRTGHDDGGPGSVYASDVAAPVLALEQAQKKSEYCEFT